MKTALLSVAAVALVVGTGGVALANGPKVAQHTAVVHTAVTHTPVVHTPVVHAPVVHAPVVHTPVVHAPVVQKTVVQKTVVHTAVTRADPQHAAVPPGDDDTIPAPQVHTQPPLMP
jgi:hypothetical protein